MPKRKSPKNSKRKQPKKPPAQRFVHRLEPATEEMLQAISAVTGERWLPVMNIGDPVPSSVPGKFEQMVLPLTEQMARAIQQRRARLKLEKQALAAWAQQKMRGCGTTLTLTPEDRYILIVLDANRGKALTFRQILNESVLMNRDNPKEIKRLSDSAIRARVAILESLGLIARPEGMKRKGIGITEPGARALQFARANPTQTQR
jgi:hypothetical protein